MTRWRNNTGHRGDSLENLIIEINKIYENKGIALITKIPVPIKVLKIVLRKIVEAFFEEKSILDFQGVVQGNSVAFDAKETNFDYLPLKNIHEHQVEYMKKFDKQKGLSFILAHFKKSDRFFLIPVDIIAKYYNEGQKGGRKSIPITDLDAKYEIDGKKGYPDYIHALELYRQEKSKQWKSERTRLAAI